MFLLCHSDGHDVEFLLGEKTIKDRLFYKLVNPRYKPVPYLDTLRCYVVDKQLLTNESKGTVEISGYNFGDEPRETEEGMWL